MGLADETRNTSLNVIAGIGLMVSAFAAVFLVGLILHPKEETTKNIIIALVMMAGGSFIYMLCTGKMRKPLYILIPITCIASFIGIVIITSEKYNAETLTGLYLYIMLVLCPILPIIVYMLVRRYYKKKESEIIK